MPLLDLGARRGHVHLGVHAVQRARELERLAPRVRHRHVRRNPQVQVEVGAVRRPRRAPAEAAFDRADVGDALHVAVRHLLLPARQPLEHRVEHGPHAQDRVLVAPALAERRVDEGPARRAVARASRSARARACSPSARRGCTCRPRRRARRGSASRPRSRGTPRPARRPAASSRSRPRRRRSSRRRAAARRRPSASARPRRTTRPRPSCSRCRGRRSARPARSPPAGSRGSPAATARVPSTTCRGAR